MLYTKLIILHFFISIVYFIVRAKDNKVQAVCEFFIVALIPGFGLAFLLAIRSIRGGAEDPSYMYHDFQDDKSFLQGFTNKQDSNIIAVQDVLIMGDTRIKRSILGDVIRRNILQNNNVLFEAIRDTDSEVSHYAVSMITHKISELESILHELERKLKDNPKDVEVLKQYADVISIYLVTSVLDNVSWQKFARLYADTLEMLIYLGIDEKKYYVEKINSELKLEDYKKARDFCQLFYGEFPEDEEPYLLFMKLYYQTGNYHELRETMSKLKTSNVHFSNRALQIVRFWDGREQNAS